MKQLLIKTIKAAEDRLHPWLHVDKFLHFSGCFLATLWSWEFAAGLGIGKEVGDHFNPNSKFSVLDLVADAFGIVTGLLIKHYLL